MKDRNVELHRAASRVGEPIYSASAIYWMLRELYRDTSSSVPNASRIEKYAREQDLTIDARFLSIKPRRGIARAFIRKPHLEGIADALGIPTSLTDFEQAVERLHYRF